MFIRDYDHAVWPVHGRKFEKIFEYPGVFDFSKLLAWSRMLVFNADMCILRSMIDEGIHIYVSDSPASWFEGKKIETIWIGNTCSSVWANEKRHPINLPFLSFAYFICACVCFILIIFMCDLCDGFYFHFKRAPFFL